LYTNEYSTKQHCNNNAVKNSTVSPVHYSAVQYRTVQYSTVQYSTVLYSTVQCCTVLYRLYKKRLRTTDLCNIPNLTTRLGSGRRGFDWRLELTRSSVISQTWSSFRRTISLNLPAHLDISVIKGNVAKLIPKSSGF